MPRHAVLRGRMMGREDGFVMLRESLKASREALNADIV
jgi:hypothetical protein